MWGNQYMGSSQKLVRTAKQAKTWEKLNQPRKTMYGEIMTNYHIAMWRKQRRDIMKNSNDMCTLRNNIVLTHYTNEPS